MRYAYALAALLLAAPAFAGPAHVYIPAEALQATDNPCTRIEPVSAGGQKTMWACSPGQSVWSPIAFPDTALITGTCAGGDNDGTACSVTSPTCTGGGHCASFFSIDVYFRVNSTDTTKAVCFEPAAEATIVDGNWAVNDGLDATPVRASTSVSAFLNGELITHSTLIEAWDSVNGQTCQRSVCSNAPMYLLVRRADTINCTNDLSGTDAEVFQVDVRWSVP